MAQEALELCYRSLVTASESIKARQQGWPFGVFLLDGELFLVRHLWVLKEVVVVGFELGGGYGVELRENAALVRDESMTGVLSLSLCVSELFYTFAGV